MQIGKKYTSTFVVEEKHLACNVGSGDLKVLATPMMMAFMENAAMMCVADELEADSSTVGGQINASHLKPTGLGHTVTAIAELVAIDGRKLSFKVSAYDEDGLIGEGDHLRFVVGRERFMSKVTNLNSVKLNNGLEIPKIGVGTWTLRDEIATKNVALALQAGFRHIDTAQMYENEAAVGQGLIESGVPRESYFLTTKVSTVNMRKGREGVRKAIEQSIADLKTPYLDLLLIHWPVEGCVKDTWQIMEEFVKAGKIRSIGVSNFNRHHLEELLSYAEIRPVINQIEVTPFMSQEENIAYNREIGIQVEAWGPFGQGNIDIVGQPLLQSLAKKYNKTASQIVLRWIVQRDLITIPRAKPNHFTENLEILKFCLSEEDMQAINGMNQSLRSNEKNDPENFPW